MTVMGIICILILIGLSISAFIMLFIAIISDLYPINIVNIIYEDIRNISDTLLNELLEEAESIKCKRAELKAKELYGLEAMMRDDELSELASRLTALNELNEARIAFIKTLYFKAFAYGQDYDMPVIEYIKCQLYPKHKNALINYHRLNYLNYNEL